MGILNNINHVFNGKKYAIENIEKRDALIRERIKKYYEKKNFKEENKLEDDYIVKGVKSELYKEYMKAINENNKNVYKYFFEDKEETDVFNRKVDTAINTLYTLFSQVEAFYKRSISKNGESYVNQYQMAQESVDKIYNLYESAFETNKRVRK